MFNKLILFAVRLLFKPSYQRFKKSLQSPRATQRKILSQLVKDCARTEYGKSLGLTGNETEEQFRAQVPICDFEDEVLSGWVDKQKLHRKRSILSPGGVQIFEKTSGGSGNHKLIPYNRPLLKSFDSYFRIWASDLLAHGPKLKSLRIFLSVSPSFKSKDEIAQHIGLEDDANYLSACSRFMLSKFLTVPSDIKGIQEPVEFLDRLCAHLVVDRSLEIISIWHPSYFFVIWNHLKSRRRLIATRVEKMSGKSGQWLLLQSDTDIKPADLWPDLKIISSWEASNSWLAAQRLKDLLPGVFFQAKGLLATEAPMTITLINQGPMPFITEVLFEFSDDEGRLFWIDEIKHGGEYSLIISQRGGLLRYRMGDRVRVSLKRGQVTPALEFIGRDHENSDLVGEKMTTSFIFKHEADFKAAYQNSSYMFLPVQREKPFYLLLVDAAANEEAGFDGTLSRWWESRLYQSYHYQYARKLGQIEKVHALKIRDLQHGLLSYYVEKKQMKLGDVKLRTLVSDPGESIKILNYLGVEA